VNQVNVITIARQFGAGGSELAQALGKRLGWRVLEREIIRAAASELDSDVEHTEYLDEYVESTLERMGKDFILGVPEGFIEPTYEIDPDDLAKASHRFILAAAERSAPIIIVGHGAQCLLAQRPRTLHVRVTAPATYRADCVAKRMKLDLESAKAEVTKRDAERAKYLRHHFNVDNNDPNLYAVQFNTAYLCVADVTETVTRLVDQAARVAA
jgi:cytidylate kinase